MSSRLLLAAVAIPALLGPMTSTPARAADAIAIAIVLSAPADGAPRPPAPVTATIVPGPISEPGHAMIPIGMGDTLRVRIDTNPGQPFRPALQARTDTMSLPGGATLSLTPSLTLEHAPDGHRYASPAMSLKIDQALAREAHGFVQVDGDQISLDRETLPLVNLSAGMAWHPSRRLSMDVSAVRGLTPGAMPMQGRGALTVAF